jgi:hypothetical protein
MKRFPYWLCIFGVTIADNIILDAFPEARFIVLIPSMILAGWICGKRAGDAGVNVRLRVAIALLIPFGAGVVGFFRAKTVNRSPGSSPPSEL